MMYWDGPGPIDFKLKENPMKVTLLCENQVGHKGARNCKAEWGFSAFIEASGKNILFDTGATGLYWDNAEALKIPIEQTDMIAFSHYHWDHTGGLPGHHFKSKKTVLMHPDALDKLDKPVRESLEKDFQPLYSTDPVEIAEGLYFLGEIPRVSLFERGMYKDDPIKDDTALVYKSDKGCIVITGCSHSGICNICEYAKLVSGQKLRAVIGGFHLMKNDGDLIEKTLDYFKNEAPELIYPLHCVDFEIQSLFHSQFGTEKLSTGDTLTF